MSTLTLPISTFETVPMPPVCARTGRPADRTTVVSAYRTPPVAWLGLILAGWIVFWLLSRGGRRIDLTLPSSGWVTKRRVLGWAVTFGGIVALVVTSRVGAQQPGDRGVAVIMALLVVSLLMIVIGPLLVLTADVEARFAGPDRIRLRRVHPDFVAAYTQVASGV